MVEIALDSLEPAQLSKDLFVSIRVGEAQKLAKASAGGRQFKFPEKAFANRKYGKLELFRHIGSCTFAASEKFRNSTQDLSMCCEDGRDNVRFRITMGSGAKAPGALPHSAQEQGPGTSAARAYLEAHRLELRMSEAMDLLLHEKPEDPASFLYARLRRNKDMLSVVKPSAPVAAPASQAPDFDKVRQDACGKIVDASENGRLGQMLRAVEDPRLDELRRDTHKVLIEATCDGRLQRILEASQREATHEARAVDASADGVLAACLAEATKPAVDGNMPINMEALRAETNQALLSAAHDGRLERLLESMKAPRPPPPSTPAAAAASAAEQEPQALREATTKALVVASGDGSLHRILGAVKAPDISDDIRQALLLASADGSLHRLIEAVKPQTPGPIVALEPFRTDTCRTLTAALQDGRLERAVLALQAQEGGVRVEACKALVAAIHDGRLEKALHATKEVQDDALQRCLGERLQAAVEDGRLRAALESSISCGPNA